MVTKNSGFKCMECGKVFRTVAAAEKASSQGCPSCGGCDVDLAGPEAYRPTARAGS